MRQSHCRGVGAAPPQKCHFAIARNALRPRHHRHDAVIQSLAHSAGANLCDACALMRGIGDEPCLAARERHRRHIQIVKSQTQQGHGFAFACGNEHVHLSPRTACGHICGEAVEGIGLFAHCAHHHGRGVAVRAGEADMAGDFSYPRRVGHRGAAEFLHHKCHALTLPLASCLASVIRLPYSGHLSCNFQIAKESKPR